MEREYTIQVRDMVSVVVPFPWLYKINVVTKTRTRIKWIVRDILIGSFSSGVYFVSDLRLSNGYSVLDLFPGEMEEPLVYPSIPTVPMLLQGTGTVTFFGYRPRVRCHTKRTRLFKGVHTTLDEDD